jgi:hypothetical protein
MGIVLNLGTRVRLLHDDGWGQPGCIIACAGEFLRVYWPDDDRATNELSANLVPYEARQPHELVA